MIGRVKNGPFFHLGDTRGYANDHLHVRKEAAAAPDHIDEPFDHILGGLKIGDDAVLKRAYRFYIFVRLFVHHHCLLTHGNRVARTAVNGHYGRFVDHHLAILNNQGIRSTKVDCQFLFKEPEQFHSTLSPD
jgi:hypothetical protein